MALIERKPIVTPNNFVENRPASLQCRWCLYRAKQPGHLREHERTHTGERPYKCRFCPMAAKTSSNIKVHERIHTNAKPYTCAECGIRYRQKQSLREHQFRIHARHLRQQDNNSVSD